MHTLICMHVCLHAVWLYVSGLKVGWMTMDNVNHFFDDHPQTKLSGCARFFSTLGVC